MMTAKALIFAVTTSLAMTLGNCDIPKSAENCTGTISFDTYNALSMYPFIWTLTLNGDGTADLNFWTEEWSEDINGMRADEATVTSLCTELKRITPEDYPIDDAFGFEWDTSADSGVSYDLQRYEKALEATEQLIGKDLLQELYDRVEQR